MFVCSARPSSNTKEVKRDPRVAAVLLKVVVDVKEIRASMKSLLALARRIYGSALPVDLLQEASASLIVWLVRLWLEPTKFGLSLLSAGGV